MAISNLVLEIQHLVRDSPDKPEGALGGSVLLGLELVSAQVLDGQGLLRGGGLSDTEFLQLGTNQSAKAQ